jgi:hypothetical protein
LLLPPPSPSTGCWMRCASDCDDHPRYGNLLPLLRGADRNSILPVRFWVRRIWSLGTAVSVVSGGRWFPVARARLMPKWREARRDHHGVWICSRCRRADRGCPQAVGAKVDGAGRQAQ